MAAIKIVTRGDGVKGWRLPDCEKCGRVVNSFDRDLMNFECPNAECPLEVNSIEKLHREVKKAHVEFRKEVKK